MANFRFSDRKNEELKAKRKLCFEDFLPFLELKMYKIIPNPNQKAYKGEMAFLVEYSDYPHIIPFLERDAEIYLKTIIPMRRFKNEEE